MGDLSVEIPRAIRRALHRHVCDCGDDAHNVTLGVCDIDELTEVVDDALRRVLLAHLLERVTGEVGKKRDA